MAYGILFTQGVVSGEPHRVLAEVLEQARAADALGFDAALTTEHKDSDEYFGAPLHLAFAIAASTERVKVGTSVALAPLYHPIELAQAAAMLDQLSGGRLFLGLGAGYLAEDFTTMGVPFADRAQRLDETVRIIREAWTKDRFSFADKIYTFDDVSVRPKPYQRPTPPLHLAAWTPGGLRRAGRLGDGWIGNALMSVRTLRATAPVYRAAAEAAGRTGHVTSIRFCWPAATREQAERDFGATAVSMARTLWEYGAITDLPGVGSAAEITLDRLCADRFVIGTPEDCVRSLREYQELADDVLLIFRYPTGPELPKVRAAMELFAAEVLPALSS